MKLYVIGNGFDACHKIPSGYKNFKQYLDDSRVSNDKVVAFIDLLESIFPSFELWRNFENALGMLDIDEYIKRYEKLCSSTFNDSQSKQNFIDHELVALQQDINWYFREWIQSLSNDIKSVQPKLRIDNKALFLNFNYTGTLETVYGVNGNRILYIHNPDRDKVINHEFAQYVIGHSKKPLQYPADIVEEERYAQEFIDSFYKDTKLYIKKDKENASFWNALVNVDEVVVLGHSLNDVDLPYFEEITKNVDMNKVLWKFSTYNEEDEQNAEKMAQGFKIVNYEIGKIENICGVISTEIPQSI